MFMITDWAPNSVVPRTPAMGERGCSLLVLFPILTFGYLYQSINFKADDAFQNGTKEDYQTGKFLSQKTTTRYQSKVIQQYSD